VPEGTQTTGLNELKDENKVRKIGFLNKNKSATTKFVCEAPLV
jgi:hypothetical protein